MHADVNAAINIRDNYITRIQQSGQAAVNQPGEPSGHPVSGWSAIGKPETEPVDPVSGWSAIGKPETEPVDKTLTSKPSGLS